MIMRFKTGDRVVTNKTAYTGNPEAEEYRGKKGTVVGSGMVFDYMLEMDEKDVAEGSWLVNDSEIDALED